jgi:hypothetical protein
MSMMAKAAVAVYEPATNSAADQSASGQADLGSA